MRHDFPPILPFACCRMFRWHKLMVVPGESESPDYALSPRWVKNAHGAATTGMPMPSNGSEE